MIISVLALIAGFVVLVFAGDYLVNGATALARRAGVSALVVGLTVVACGTSAPELVVSVQAILTGAPELAIGNIVGSNIANVLLVLGAPAVIAPFAARAKGLGRNAFIALTASAALIVFALDLRITPIEGLVLVAGLVAYLVWQWMRARAPDALDDPTLAELAAVDEIESLPATWGKIWLFLGVGLIGLPIGSTLIVESAVDIGARMGVPPEFIGLTAVAFGTSLPELATSIIAALKREAEVAIGNVIGSNVFNVLAVGGAAAAATGFTALGHLPVPETFLAYDLRVMLVAAVGLWLIALIKPTLGRVVGIGFLVAYVAYIVVLARVEGISLNLGGAV